MENKLLSTTALILVALFVSVISISKSHAGLTVTACKHNGELFAVIETGESCIAAHQSISGAKTLHSSKNGYLIKNYSGNSIPYTATFNFHSSNCILTETISNTNGD